jgi:alkylation response protein AidB-like acyl-CoA dehydrogenase
MDIAYETMGKEDGLRRELRDLIRDHVGPDFVGAFTDDPRDLELTKRFCELLADKKLLTLSWPAEYGGGGGDGWQQTIVREEMWAHYEPRGPQYMGVNWVGPAIMEFGSPEQKKHHLPLLGSGRAIWCQGFSEPDAGTDLASLRTRAERTEEGWRIDGQKIWTSYAASADYCMLAVRTDVDRPSREGISIFLLPMNRVGVEVRPIRSMLGPQHLNELFLTEVEASDTERLGALNEGWRVIRYILTRERIGIARYARCDRLLNEVRQDIGDNWSELPAALRIRFARSVVHNRIARLLAYRAVEAAESAEVTDDIAAAARVAMIRGDQEVTDVLMEALGEASLDGPGSGSAPLGGAVEDYWRYVQAATVASGAIEVQQMLIARGVLGASGASRDK